MNATAAVCFSPLCTYPLPAGGDAWEKIGVEELDLGRVGQQMKLVYPRGPERGGANTEKVCREPDMSSPLWQTSHDIGPVEGACGLLFMET